jgi:hypothetical protein
MAGRPLPWFWWTQRWRASCPCTLRPGVNRLSSLSLNLRSTCAIPGWLECLLLSPGGLKDGELPFPVLSSKGEQTLLLISQPGVQPVLYLDGWKAFSLVLVDSKMASFLSLYSPARVNRLSSSSLNLGSNLYSTWMAGRPSP